MSNTRLGKGTFGEVRTSSCNNAIKEYFMDAHESALREITSLGVAKHDSIIPIIESQMSVTDMYIIMPKALGSLDDLICSTTSYNDSFIDMIIKTLTSAVGYIHKLGIIHRDIKPGNVLIIDRNRAVLSDFGLSKFDNESQCHSPRCGTPAYSAPEMSGCTYGPSCDNFSVGVTILETIAHRYMPENSRGIVMDPIKRYNAVWGDLITKFIDCDQKTRGVCDSDDVVLQSICKKKLTLPPPAGIELILENLEISSRYHESIVELVTSWIPLWPDNTLLEIIGCSAACVLGHGTSELDPCIRVFESHFLSVVNAVREKDPLLLYQCELVDGVHRKIVNEVCETCDMHAGSDTSSTTSPTSSRRSSSSRTSSSYRSDTSSSDWSRPDIEWDKIVTSACKQLLHLQKVLADLDATVEKKEHTQSNEHIPKSE